MKKLTYIWHDCFVYETEELIIIFDYWKDVTASTGDTPDFITHASESDKQVYVIVSHHHKDHYSKEIFGWSETIPNIKYVLSKDVAKHARHILRSDSIYNGVKPPSDSVNVISKGESYSDQFLTIEAYGSTDIGNSYVVMVGEETIFHAGDLNAWIWKDESTPQEVDEAIADFKAILTDISDAHPEIGIAMFPVDSRIGSEYYTGARLFVRHIYVRHFFPMHFGLGTTSSEQQKYQRDAARVEKYANPSRGEYICLQSPYSAFIKYSKD